MHLRQNQAYHILSPSPILYTWGSTVQASSSSRSEVDSLYLRYICSIFCIMSPWRQSKQVRNKNNYCHLNRNQEANQTTILLTLFFCPFSVSSLPGSCTKSFCADKASLLLRTVRIPWQHPTSVVFPFPSRDLSITTAIELTTDSRVASTSDARVKENEHAAQQKPYIKL